MEAGDTTTKKNIPNKQKEDGIVADSEWARKKVTEARDLIAKFAPELLPKEETVLVHVTPNGSVFDHGACFGELRGKFFIKLNSNKYKSPKDFSESEELFSTLDVVHELGHQKVNEILKEFGVDESLDPYISDEEIRSDNISYRFLEKAFNRMVDDKGSFTDEFAPICEGLPSFLEMFVLNQLITNAEHAGETEKTFLLRARKKDMVTSFNDYREESISWQYAHYRNGLVDRMKDYKEKGMVGVLESVSNFARSGGIIRRRA